MSADQDHPDVQLIDKAYVWSGLRGLIEGVYRSIMHVFSDGTASVEPTAHQKVLHLRTGQTSALRLRSFADAEQIRIDLRSLVATISARSVKSDPRATSSSWPPLTPAAFVMTKLGSAH